VHCGVGVSTEAKNAGGHFGRDKMLHTINTRWYFPLICERVTRFVKYCDVCQRTNSCKLSKTGQTLHPVPVPQKVWAQIGIDILSMPKAHGFRYIITAVDYYTKWVEAAPLTDKSSLSVARFLWDLHCRYGAADVFISDQGREFVNSVQKELFRLSGVKHRITSAYHPQANGLVERQNRTTLACIMKGCDQHLEDWPYALNSVLLSYRTTKHKSTKYTPFRLMFGRDPVILAELADEVSSGATPEVNFDGVDDEAEAQVNEEQQQDDVQEVPPEMLENLQKVEQMRETVMDKASENIKQAQDDQTFHYNIRHSSTKLKVGDRVLKKNIKDAVRLQKGCSKWIGPYTVVEVTALGMVRLKRDGHVGAKLIPPQHLKLYYVAQDLNSSSDDEAAFSQGSINSSIRTASQASQARTSKKRKREDQPSQTSEGKPSQTQKKRRLMSKRTADKIQKQQQIPPTAAPERPKGK
jgi:transposase InsO family protein